MKNLSTDPITDGAPLTPVERSFFDDLVKSAEEMPTNEMTAGENTAQDEPVPDKPEPDFTSAARQQFIEGREKLLKELLPEASSSSNPAEKKLVDQQFVTNDYETSSPQLKTASPLTLGERVRGLCGRD